MEQAVLDKVTIKAEAKSLLSLPKSEKGRRVLAYFLENGLRTKEDLRLLLVTGLGVRPQTHSMCPGHVSPFDTLWELYTEATTEAVIWANRGGSKSFEFGGLLSWLWSTFLSGCSSRILGGSRDQSKKAYEAHEYFWNITNSYHLVKGEPRMGGTRWRNGSDVEILAASQKQVRGPHQSKLFLDEVEEMDLNIFKAALSQPLSKEGIKSSTIIMSTYHKQTGVMSHIMEGLVPNGYKLYRYCIYETLEACKDLSCSRCPLSNLNCPGPEKMKYADGYYSYSDLFKKIKGLDAEGFQTEWLCLRPGSKGLVHSGFNEQVNITDKYDYNSNIDNIRVGVDFGFTNPSAWVFLQKQGEKIIQWDEVYTSGKTIPELIEILKSKLYHNHIKAKARLVCDPENPESIKVLKDAGYRAVAGYNALEEGIGRVNGLIKPLIGESLYYVHPRCEHTRREYRAYRRREYIVGGKNVVEEPIDANNHAMSANRYAIMDWVREAVDAPAMISIDPKRTITTPLGLRRRI